MEGVHRGHTALENARITGVLGEGDLARITSPESLLDPRVRRCHTSVGIARSTECEPLSSRGDVRYLGSAHRRRHGDRRSPVEHGARRGPRRRRMERSTRRTSRSQTRRRVSPAEQPESSPGGRSIRPGRPAPIPRPVDVRSRSSVRRIRRRATVVSAVNVGLRIRRVGGTGSRIPPRSAGKVPGTEPASSAPARRWRSTARDRRARRSVAPKGRRWNSASGEPAPRTWPFASRRRSGGRADRRPAGSRRRTDGRHE